jgi:hypothetical protein
MWLENGLLPQLTLADILSIVMRFELLEVICALVRSRLNPHRQGLTQLNRIAIDNPR